MDVVNTEAWVGRQTTCEGGISPQKASQILSTLGGSSQRPMSRGTALPALWHWCAFPTDTVTEHLGNDGHPTDGDVIPPLGLPRRMWAGGSLQFFAPLAVGETLRRRTTLRKIEDKSGAKGPMVFVTLEHEVFGPRGLAILETQDIVYLPMPTAYAPPKARPLPATPDHHATMEPGTPLLFRYSAVTYNAHRIHYDQVYAREVEKYPDLVVHGPLQATMLMNMACQVRGRQPSMFTFRGVHPMFAGTQMDLMACEAEHGTMKLYTGQSGHQGMEAQAIWEATP